MIADNAAAIVGGRNIGDIYYGVNTTHNYRDLDVLAVGPVVRELSGVFDQIAYPFSSGRSTSGRRRAGG
jgi:cardiolipin synthase C